MRAHRIYVGDVSDPASVDRIMAAVRAEQRVDGIGWYSHETASIPANDHPRNPGHRWTETEGDE